MFVRNRPPAIIFESVIPVTLIDLVSDLLQNTLALIIATDTIMLEKQVVLIWFAHSVIAWCKGTNIRNRTSQEYFVINNWRKLTPPEPETNYCARSTISNQR